MVRVLTLIVAGAFAAVTVVAALIGEAVTLVRMVYGRAVCSRKIVVAVRQVVMGQVAGLGGGHQDGQHGEHQRQLHGDGRVGSCREAGRAETPKLVRQQTGFIPAPADRRRRADRGKMPRGKRARTPLSPHNCVFVLCGKQLYIIVRRVL